MKKTLSIIFVFVLMLSMMSLGVSAHRGYEYTAYYATPEIDGVAEDLWDDSEWAYVDLQYREGLESDCSMKVKVLHDDEYIYFLGVATDATMTDASFDEADALQFYLDEDYCGSEEVCDLFTQLNCNVPDAQPHMPVGSKSKSGADAIVASAVTNDGDVYTFEWAFKPIAGIPEGEAVMGLEFMYNDCNTDGKFQNAYRWNVDTVAGEVAPYKQVKNYAKLILAEYVEVVDEVEAEQAPATSDAGVVVAAIFMAAAAAVVLTKKYCVSK